MSTSFGTLNVGFFSAWVSAWDVATYGPAPSDLALAVSLAMPSVVEGGHPSKRGGLKSPGKGSFYLATAFAWVHGVSHKCVDLAYFAATGSNSNKQNHMNWLRDAGLIVKYRVGNGWQIALTDAGLDRVALVSKELAREARVFSVKARDRMLRDADRASRPKRVRKVKKEAMEAPVELPASGDGVEAVI